MVTKVLKIDFPTVPIIATGISGGKLDSAKQAGPAIALSRTETEKGRMSLHDFIPLYGTPERAQQLP